MEIDLAADVDATDPAPAAPPPGPADNPGQESLPMSLMCALKPPAPAMVMAVCTVCPVWHAVQYH